MSVRSVGWWCVLACAVPVAAQNPIGLNQPVAVVVCRYQGTQAPLFTSQQWADAFNLHVSNFYRQASSQQTSFNFIAVPGVCNLSFADDQQTTDDSVNYLNSVTREGPEAVAFAEAAGVNLRVVRKVVVVVNRDHRGNATIGEWPIYRVGGLPFQGLGLTVFGEVDGTTPLMRVPDIMTQDLATTSIDVCAHELGHLLGQFDLYPYFPGVEFAGEWSQMGSQRWQHFDGYTRFKYGWLPTPSALVRDFVMPLTGAINTTVTLVPPTTPGGQAQLLRISLNPADAVTGTPSRPFFGLVVEARPKAGLDANLAGGYEEGVLVSLVTENLPQASYVVQAPAGNIAEAPFGPGESFVFAEAGLRLDVLGRTGNNFSVRVRWDAPRLPDVALLPGLLFGETADIWLDSPTNGFGTFTFPNEPGGNAPILCGDFPTVPFVIPWNDPDGPGILPAVPGLPTPAPVTHRINLRARNVGQALARGVRGNVLILQPTIPNVDLSDPANLLALGNPRTVNFGDIAAGGSAVRTVDYRPDGTPFAVIAWFDKVDTEANLLNQVGGEAFVVFQPAPGSPYDPVNVRLDVANLDLQSKVRALFALPRGVPSDWNTSMERVGAAAEPRQRVPFALRMQAPEHAKPELVRPTLQAWTDFGDAAVPIGEIPVYVDLSVRTRTTLQVKADGKNANLDGVVTPKQAGLRVTIAVSGSDGSVRYVGRPEGDVATLVTDANGGFRGALPYDERVAYRAVATFVGARELQPSVSAAVQFGAGATAGGTRPGVPIDPRRPRLNPNDLPRPLRRLAAEPAAASFEVVAPGVVVDWSAGRIIADGSSPGMPQLAAGQRRQTERRNALTAALGALRQAAETLPVTTDSTLGSFMKVSREVSTSVDELLQGFRIVDEAERPGGGFEVTVAINLNGREGLLSRVLPAVQRFEAEAGRTLPPATGPRVSLAPTRPDASSFPTRSVEPFSGLVVDCTGLGLRRAMAPKIVLEDETEVWGTIVRIDPEKVRDEGLVAYLPSLDEATDAANSKAGKNPLVITAIGVAGRFKANPVVSQADADTILKEEERGHFLEQLRIVFVVD